MNQKQFCSTFSFTMAQLDKIVKDMLQFTDEMEVELEQQKMTFAQVCNHYHIIISIAPVHSNWSLYYIVIAIIFLTLETHFLLFRMSKHWRMQWKTKRKKKRRKRIYSGSIIQGAHCYPFITRNIWHGELR